MLYCDGVNVGGYDRMAGRYRPLTKHDSWGPACDPPIPVPNYWQTFDPRPPDPTRFGFLPHAPVGAGGYKINGQAANRQTVVAAIQNHTLQDDSKKLWVVIIGDDADRKKIRQQIDAVPESKHAIVVDYPSDHWHVDGVFVTDSPTVYIQHPDGTVLARMQQPPDGQTLGKVLRRLREKYDPTLDPDPLLVINPLNFIPTWVWVIVGTGAVLLLLRPKQSPPNESEDTLL